LGIAVRPAGALGPVADVGKVNELDVAPAETAVGAVDPVPAAIDGAFSPSFNPKCRVPSELELEPLFNYMIKTTVNTYNWGWG
jgi:hypothetical protein